MKLKSLIAAAFLSLGGLCHADTPGTQPIGPFGGLNTNISQEAIDATQSPDLLNVDITAGGKSVKKRQGYGLDVSLAISTSAVHNLYKFFDSSGNEVRLAFNDNKVSSSINGAAWSTIITTGTVGATWDCTDYLGFAYCVSSLFDNPIKTNGTSAGTTGVGFANGVPAGSLISNSGDRLLVGATASNPSRLYYSASASFTDFSLGIQPSNSSFEDIVAPGSKLTHLSYHFGRWLWWKDQSFGFIVGTGQFDLQIITVSNTIGTLDNTDVYDGNYVYFRGSDSQIYTYDGSTLSRSISTDIGPTLRSANRRKSNLWTQTSQSDFANGYFITTSSTVSSGDLTLGRMSNTFSNLNNWTTVSGAFSVSGNKLVVAPNSGTDWIYSVPISTMSNAWILSFQYNFTSAVSQSGAICRVLVSSGAAATTGYGVRIQGNTSNNSAFIVGPDISNASGSTTYSMDTNTHTASLTRSATGSMLLYVDGALSASFVENSNTFFNTLQVLCNMTSASVGMNISNLYVSASTGTYYSAVNNAPNLTSWNTFAATDQSNGGNITYYTRGGGTLFSVLSSTPAWQLQTKGSTVSASTGTYMQARIDFSVDAATETPTVNDFTFNWFEGSASDKMYGTYFNNGIWFSVSLSTATANNRILRYDLLSNLWTLYDIPANGFLTYNNNLYFAGPSTGCVFQFGNGVYSDNGAAINAYWKSKPFFGDSPFSDDDLRNASWYIAYDSGTTLNMTYTLNESTTVTHSINLYDSRRNIIQNSWNFPQGSIGTNFSAQFGDNSTNAPWEVFGGLLTFISRPWKVYP